MRLLLLADTHVPARARDLPPEVWAAVDEANLVIHAGDWVSVELLDRLEARAEILVGVHGNNDGPELRARLPEVQRFDVSGLQVARRPRNRASRTGREARADARFPLDNLVIFGHSHIPWDTVTPAGKRMLNPGSPTDRRSQPACTYMTATVTDGGLSDVTLHALPVRARVSTPRSAQLPPSVRATTLEVRGGPLAVLTCTPPTAVDTVVLVPGYTGGKEDFLAVLEPIASYGHTVADLRPARPVRVPRRRRPGLVHDRGSCRRAARPASSAGSGPRRRALLRRPGRPRRRDPRARGVSLADPAVLGTGGLARGKS